MRLNIQRKYTLFIISLLLFVVIVLFAIAYQQFTKISASYIQSSSQLTSQALLRGMEKRGIVIAQLLSENLVNPIYSYDQSAVSKLVQGYKSYNNVTGIYVYDTQGNLIHDGSGSVDMYGLTLRDDPHVQQVLLHHKPVSHTNNSSIVVYHPVMLDETTLGGVKVIFSLAEIQNSLREMQAQLTALSYSSRNRAYRDLLIALGLIIFIGVLLSYTLALRISIPITKMARYATLVGQGNYLNRLDYKAEDEIGELAQAFNNMQQNLMHSTVSIQELEKQVDLRTSELAKLNDDLKLHKEQLETTVAARTSELLEANRCLSQEIDERRRVQEKLVRAKKMEAIGTLAAAVAHDLNNILTGIVGIPDLMLLNIPKNGPLADDILKIKKCGLRAAAVVQDLLNLARKNVSCNMPLHLGSVIDQYLKSPEHSDILHNCPGVVIQANIPPDRYMVMGSQVHLTKALMNLISNAAESMPGGGHITVSLEKKLVDPSEDGHPEFKKGEYIRLQVRDTGDGISAENLGRIFEPFYTTKAMGRSGSGLGLTVVRETVKDHNGYMDVQSTVGKGTAFSLYFPSTAVEPPKAQEEAQCENYRGNGEAILIVDDLESQRNLLKSIMDRLGYRAKSVPSGEDAVEYLKGHSADLIILDMMMAPGMDGLDTYREISKVNPGQKAIMVSGYSDTTRTKQLQNMGVETYIRKPYTVKQIGRAVRAELDRHTSLSNTAC